MLTLGEQEVGKAHIIRRSIYPLIVRLILLNLLWLLTNFVYGLAAFEINGVATLPAFLGINFVILFIVQVFFGAISIILTLNWLSEIYIIDFPTVIIRKGIFQIEEKNLTVHKVDNIIIHQGSLGKIFDYGTISFDKAIREGLILEDLILPDVPAPHHLEKIFKK